MAVGEEEKMRDSGFHLNKGVFIYKTRTWTGPSVLDRVECGLNPEPFLGLESGSTRNL